MKKTNSVDCFKCKHFYVTWEPSNPRGCRAFGFKTAKMPSQVVLETSGEICLKFVPKEPDKSGRNQNPGNRNNGNGWIA